MSKRLFFPAGIAAEILMLLLILGAWHRDAADTAAEPNTAVSAGADRMADGEGVGNRQKVEKMGNRQKVEKMGNRQKVEKIGNRQKEKGEEKKQDYIKWVEFNVSYEALDHAYTVDVETYQKDVHLNWIELLAYLGAKYGGDFTNYKEKDMKNAADRLISGETTIEGLTADMQYYDYYLEAYKAVLKGMVGEYEIEKEGREGSGKKAWKKYYGLKAFGPIAKTFPYSDYDDFGVSRSYGYQRNHLGHDMMGQVGTPVVAVESGYIAVMGWNQYGGWRIGINSFDKKRYYYYAHLRQNIPYAESLKEGDVVQAGDVIGYMGRTGYSSTENVNNIDIYHLHLGLQLIFDESQREGKNEIWVDIYPLVKFLSRNRSEVLRNDANKEWYRKYRIKDPAAEMFKKNLTDNTGN